MLKKIFIALGVAFVFLIILQVVFPGAAWINILGLLSVAMVVLAPLFLVALFIMETVRKNKK